MSEHPTHREPLLRKYSESPQSPLPKDTGKFGNPYLRFTILFAFLVVAIAFMPLWISPIFPKQAAVVIAAVMMFFSLLWVTIAFNAARNYRKLDFAPIAAWEESLTLRDRAFKHIVIVPCYLDPLDVLHNCIETLVFQARPEDLVVIVTFEKKTPDLEEKMSSVRSAFADKFGDFLIVVHELKKRKEIPGGCSNKNFALREAYKYCSKQHGQGWHTSRYTITTCDTDSKFHPRYFETLEAAYNAENPREDVSVKMNVWQPSLFYNWNLDERPFFNRVTCIMRMMMMLGGLISFNINPMSIFSYPMELGYAAGFINPRYSVDDIIFKVRCMCDTNTSVPVKLLPVIVISGPTIGTTFMEEVWEWGRQCRRWIVGASESFHYFIIHWKGKPFFSALMWFFIFFNCYGALLCCAGIFQVFGSIPYPWVHYPEIPLTDGFSFSLKYAGAVALALQMFAFAIGFVLDALGARRLGLEEDISPLRNLLHWLSSPFVLLTYSVIAFVSIVRFMFEGKKMAGHDMAAKEGLKADETTTTASPSGAAGMSTAARRREAEEYPTTTVVEQRHNEPKDIARVHCGSSMRDSFVSSHAMPSQAYYHSYTSNNTSARAITSQRSYGGTAGSSRSIAPEPSESLQNGGQARTSAASREPHSGAQLLNSLNSDEE